MSPLMPSTSIRQITECVDNLWIATECGRMYADSYQSANDEDDATLQHIYVWFKYCEEEKLSEGKVVAELVRGADEKSDAYQILSTDVEEMLGIFYFTLIDISTINGIPRWTFRRLRPEPHVEYFEDT